MASYIVLLAALATLPVSNHSVSQSLPAAGVARVIATNWRGDVTMTASAAEHVVVLSRVIVGDSSCDATARLEGDMLVVEAARGQRCRVDVELQVPAKVAIECVTGTGDLRVRGTHGSVRVRTGSGNVHLDGVVTQLTASLGSGDLRASQLAGDATVRQGGGSSTLQCVGHGEISLRVGAGDVDVQLPRGSSVVHHLTVGAGDVRTEVATAAQAPWVVRGSVGAGRVRIRAVP